MKFSNINPKDVIFALDIGTRSIIGTVGIVKEKKFHCIAESYIEHEERAMIDGQIQDIDLVAVGVNKVKIQLENELNFKLKNVAIAAAGRFLRTTTARADLNLDFDREIDKETIRSIELTAVKNAEEYINTQTEGKLYCIGYSVKNYYLNDYIISNLLSHKGDKASAEVIATFLPRSVVESLYAVMEKVGLNVINLTLEPIAAMEAAIPKSLRLLNLALIDIGAGTSDIAISSKDTISAYGMIPNAGDEVTEAVAQNFLVDFNTAERIKKECSVKDSITFTDVLGVSNEIMPSEVIKVIEPVVNKICEELASKIIELNLGKAPNAVFLVGGGAHTPKLLETLAQKLNLPLQRIAIKGREAVAGCVCLDDSLGSTGVTVLGIALNSIMKFGHDFIDVTLNGNVISLLNSQKHTVADVLMQAEINPRVLIGKNGKNLRYTFNGVRRIAFGTLGTNAEIKVNEKLCNVDSEVKERDQIEIEYAKDGKDASPKILDVIQKLDSISFYLDDNITHIEPIAFINNTKVELREIIKDGDEVNIVFPNSVLNFKTYIDNDKKDCEYYMNQEMLKDDYVIKDGDRIYRKFYNEHNESEAIDETEHKSENQETEYKDNNVKLDTASTSQQQTNEVKILVNGDKVYLKNKEKYIFIDVFDYINFDLTRAQGNLALLLNGKKAGYYDELSEGDEIKIYWE